MRHPLVGSIMCTEGNNSVVFTITFVYWSKVTNHLCWDSNRFFYTDFVIVLEKILNINTGLFAFIIKSYLFIGFHEKYLLWTNCFNYFIENKTTKAQLVEQTMHRKSLCLTKWMKLKKVTKVLIFAQNIKMYMAIFLLTMPRYQDLKLGKSSIKVLRVYHSFLVIKFCYSSILASNMALG